MESSLDRDDRIPIAVAYNYRTAIVINLHCFVAVVDVCCFGAIIREHRSHGATFAYANRCVECVCVCVALNELLIDSSFAPTVPCPPYIPRAREHWLRAPSITSKRLRQAQHGVTQ